MHAAHLVLSAHQQRGDAAPSEAVGQALGDISAAIAELDASLSDLRGTPAGVTLLDDLRVRAEELEAAGGIPVRVYGSCPRLPPATAGHVLHVLGEAMTNAVRHSHGTAVATGLHVEGDRLVGSVHDDGRGLARHDPRGHGFQSMAERAEILGGRLEVTASRLGGTTVRLEVPLAEERAG
jgi:signal transduction histidine kinase